jgi:hypothetical protein
MYVAVRLGKDTFNFRKDYGQKHATYRRVKSSLKYLNEIGLISQTTGFRDPVTNKGKATRIRLEASARVLFSGNSFIERLQSPPVLIKDSNKNLVKPNKFKSFRRLSNKVNNWNKSLETHNFSINESITSFIYQVVSLLGRNEKSSIDYSQFSSYFGKGNPIKLQRIFNDGSVKKGGRIYTDLQNIKKELRAAIRINGAQTIEKDYSNLHARMLYNKLGQNPVGDLYQTEKHSRKALKTAFSTAINTSSRLQAENALRSWLKPSNRPNSRAVDLLDWLELNHSALLPFFYKQVGLGLMFEESLMTTFVLDYFISKGEAVLPIHDSFVVRKEFESELVSVMDQAYQKQNGFKCAIA